MWHNFLTNLMVGFDVHLKIKPPYSHQSEPSCQRLSVLLPIYQPVVWNSNKQLHITFHNTYYTKFSEVGIANKSQYLRGRNITPFCDWFSFTLFLLSRGIFIFLRLTTALWLCLLRIFSAFVMRLFLLLLLLVVHRCTGLGMLNLCSCLLVGVCRILLVSGVFYRLRVGTSFLLQFNVILLRTRPTKENVPSDQSVAGTI